MRLAKHFEHIRVLYNIYMILFLLPNKKENPKFFSCGNREQRHAYLFLDKVVMGYINESKLHIRRKCYTVTYYQTSIKINFLFLVILVN